MSDVRVSENEINWLFKFPRYTLEVPKLHYDSCQQALDDLLFEDIDSEKVQGYLILE